MSRDKNKDVFAERLALLDSARSNTDHSKSELSNTGRTNAGRAKSKRSRAQRKEKTTDLRMKAPKRSRGKIAISGLPANTSYEAMKIRGFVTQHEFGNDDECRKCMIRPWRKPQPVWIAWQKAQKDKGIKS